MVRNPLALIRGHLDFFQERLTQASAANGESAYINELRAKIGLLQMIETDMEIEYFPLGDKTTLGELRKGAVFATEDGVYAVKSEYHNDGFIDPVADSEGVNLQCQCVLFSSGEYAHFANGNATIVYEVIQPREREEQ